jgi:glycerol-3-phosphate acyltransferase PlsX
MYGPRALAEQQIHEGDARTEVSDSVVISVDAMGGDFGPSIVAPGLGLALKRLNGRGVRFLLHGDEALLNQELAKVPEVRAVSEVRPAELVIGMQDKPAQAVRRGKGSSLWNAVEAIRAGEADAALSAGNTGALMAISKLILRMVSAELDRPAIVASWPTARGVSTVLDVGANVTSDAAQLVEFAIMGEAFHRAAHGVARPRVGILNVGSEDMKGHEEVREAHRILKDEGLPIDYHGFVEGDDIAKGTVDVVVTDGFTGNIALKTAEGVARFVRDLLREAFTSELRAKVGAAVAAPTLRKMMARLDPGSLNGAPLLGLKGIVVKSHGGADARSFANAVVVAADMARSDFSSVIDANMSRLAEVLAKASEAGAPALASAAEAQPGESSKAPPGA